MWSARLGAQFEGSCTASRGSASCLVETQFKTLKNRPAFPGAPFSTYSFFNSTTEDRRAVGAGERQGDRPPSPREGEVRHGPVGRLHAGPVGVERGVGVPCAPPALPGRIGHRMGRST